MPDHAPAGLPTRRTRTPKVRVRRMVALLGLLLILPAALLVYVNFQSVSGPSERSPEQLFVGGEIDVALLQYRLDTGSYPTTKQGLRALWELPDGVPNWKGSYLKAGAKLQDPWHRDYNYAFPGVHNGPDKYDCWSSGPDGISGTPDDVGNWPPQEASAETKS